MFNQYNHKKAYTQDELPITQSLNKDKKPDLSYCQWIEKVEGTAEQIRDAIRKLGRQPKDDIELYFKIFAENKGKALSKVLDEAAKQSEYTPY